MVDRRGGGGFLLEPFQGDAACNCEKASRGEVNGRGLVEMVLSNLDIIREGGKAKTSLSSSFGEVEEKRVSGVRRWESGGARGKFEDKCITDATGRGKTEEGEDE